MTIDPTGTQILLGIPSTPTNVGRRVIHVSEGYELKSSAWKTLPKGGRAIFDPASEDSDAIYKNYFLGRV
jgi:hypothetical protein